MKISYKKELTKSLMIVENDIPFDPDSFSAKMISSNHIPHLLEFQSELIDGKANYGFNISSKQSLCRLFEIEKLNTALLKSFLSSLSQLSHALCNYLLSINDIVFDKDFIFFDSNEDNFYFCFLPQKKDSCFEDISELFNYFLSVLDYKDQSGAALCFEAVNVLQNENFIIDDLISLCRKENEIGTFLPEISGNDEVKSFEDAPVHAKINDASNFVFDEVALLPDKPVKPSFSQKLKNYFKGKKLKTIVDDINSGEIIDKIKEQEASQFIEEPTPENDHKVDCKSSSSTSNPIFCDFELPKEATPFAQTTVLNEDFPNTLSLFSITNPKALPIGVTRTPFIIGKNPASCDACIPSDAISRVHGRISFDEYGTEGFFYEDLNSTNGSKLNGTALPAYTKTPLKAGDVLCLANEELDVRC